MTTRTDMQDYLPRYYDDSAFVNGILDAEAIEIDSLKGEIQDVLDQFFIDTATWGLTNWERVCGITKDTTKTYAERRSVIKSKLRGIGIVTVNLINTVAESYNNGEVEVIESPSIYTITIKFVSTIGIPSRIDDIKNALREIIPAHLAINYEFKYNTWEQVATKTWEEIATYTWDQVYQGNIF
ncbi:putative phage tail protein [Paenibacillus alkalitolerans]|uniref:putative phage tail protein n=1 Tax=Paenibacillus alkalitolerans TaxID=2799335 RepID=UPI001F319AD3|nr:putative phage tail protein [Paenibacillus alkalitolerans]